MGITSGIVQYLLANSAVVAALGTSPNTSIVPVGLVKGIISPYIVYHIGTTLDTNDALGATGYRLARVQFDCYSTLSYTEAKALAKAVRGVFQNLQNTTLSDGTFVQGCLISQESDMPWVPEGISTVEYRVMVEVTVFYRE